MNNQRVKVCLKIQAAAAILHGAISKSFIFLFSNYQHSVEMFRMKTAVFYTNKFEIDAYLRVI